MKCPHCGLYTLGAPRRCPGCDFTIADLDRALGRPPEPRGLLNDLAGALGAADAAALAQDLEAFQRDCGGPLVVAVVPATAPASPAEYAFWLFNRWEVGGPEGRGLLLLVALRERCIECEEGYGWEALAADEETGEILSREAVPRLARGEIAAALDHTARALRDLIVPRAAAEARR